jgi:hypothetical protein
MQPASASATAPMSSLIANVPSAFGSRAGQNASERSPVMMSTPSVSSVIDTV